MLPSYYDYYYHFYQNPEFFWFHTREGISLLILGSIVLLVLLLVAGASGAFDGPPKPRLKTPEELDQDAEWSRARARQLQAASELEIAEAQYNETQRVLNDNRVR